MKKCTALITALVMLLSLGLMSVSAMADEQITLNFWHIWPTDQMAQIVADYIAIYEAEHPNIHVESSAYQEVDYQTQKLPIAASTKSQGDVFFCWGGGSAKPYVDSGAVLKLDEYLEKYNVREDLLDGTLTYGTYDGGVYGLPLKQWAGVLFCNQELFDQYNVKIPATWDEMMTAVETFRANGITPLVLGAKDAWHIGMIQNALAVRTAGPDYVNAALSGEVTMNTEEIVRSAQLLVDLNKAEAFCNGTLGISSEEAQEEFYMGMVAMYFGGSWCASGCDSADNDLVGKVTVAPLPVVEGGKGDATTYSGGVIDFMMVNAATEHPDEAFDFALGMTKYMSQECYKIGDSLPAWKLGDIDDSEVSPTLIAIKDLIQNSTGYVLAWDTFLTGAAIDAHYQALQGLIAGTMTPEEFAVAMDEAVKAMYAED
ncbi:MAG: extracellular solute-binding protein [Clostridia bacterium]|nr:extracellular solute-binding protein [Clostridia bacterium]